MARADTISQERRRRNTDALGGRRQRLATRADLDGEKFAYRWVNDDGNRLHDLTVSDDWEVVSDRAGEVKPDGTGVGSEVATPVGTGENGRPVRAVLLRKKKDWYDEDERAKQRRIDETEVGLKAGAAPGATTDDKTYVPKGGIVFENGAKS